MTPDGCASPCRWYRTKEALKRCQWQLRSVDSQPHQPLECARLQQLQLRRRQDGQACTQCTFPTSLDCRGNRSDGGCECACALSTRTAHYCIVPIRLESSKVGSRGQRIGAPASSLDNATRSACRICWTISKAEGARTLAVKPLGTSQTHHVLVKL